MMKFLNLNKRNNTIQNILYCHPQLDPITIGRGSQYLQIDSRFHGNDSRAHFLDRLVIFLKVKISAILLQGGKLFLILLLIVSSCSNPYKNLTKTELELNQVKDIPYSLPDIEKPVIYKTDIQFYKNNISGLLIIKKTSDKVYRIALTTQFGLKIFDFELDHGKLNTKYCIEYLDKRLILNTFQTDFNLLLMQFEYNSFAAFENATDNQRIWQLSSGKLYYDYIENYSMQKLENIYFRKRNSKKISVGLHNYQGDIPSEITLEHHNINLKMQLKLIK